MLVQHDNHSPSARGWHSFPGCLRVAVICVVVAFGLPVRAQESAGEYQRKAIRIQRLARYVEWPKDKMGRGVPLVIGVFGNDMISDQIREVVAGRKINDREVVVKLCSTLQEIPSCHILFVSRSEEGRFGDIISKAKSNQVLAVGETEAFLRKGGAVWLNSLGNEVQMSFSFKNAKRADITLAPQLLELGEAAGG
jgi:hypothetical protein